jgi:hypothetical protein
MKISAFTIIESDDMLEKSIRSVYPFVDEFVINMHGATDIHKDMLGRVAMDFPDTKIVVFTEETEDKVKACIDNCTGDWIFEFFNDEAIHEAHAKKFRDWVERAEAEDIEGVTFTHLFFKKDDHKTLLGKGIAPTVRLFKRGALVPTDNPPASHVLDTVLYIFKYMDETPSLIAGEPEETNTQHPKVMLEE